MPQRRNGRSVSGRTRTKKPVRSVLTPGFHELGVTLGMRHFGLAKKVSKSARPGGELDIERGSLLLNHQPFDRDTPSAIYSRYPEEVSFSGDRSRSIFTLSPEDADEVYLYINTLREQGVPEFRINGARTAEMNGKRRGHFLRLTDILTSSKDKPLTAAILVNERVVTLMRIYLQLPINGAMRCVVDCQTPSSSQELPTLPSTQEGESKSA